jgi:hypothetical protein
MDLSGDGADLALDVEEPLGIERRVNRAGAEALQGDVGGLEPPAGGPACDRGGQHAAAAYLVAHVPVTGQGRHRAVSEVGSP